VAFHCALLALAIVIVEALPWGKSPNQKKPAPAPQRVQVSIPDVFLFGAARCATTSVHRVLFSNPAICMPFTKAPNFFGSQNFNKAADERYRRNFNNTQPVLKRNCTLRLDSTPYFGHSEIAIHNMEQYYKRKDLLTKNFIIILREPARRLFSFYDSVVGLMIQHIKKLIINMKPQTVIDHFGMPYHGYPLAKFCNRIQRHWGCRNVSVDSVYLQHPEQMFKTFEQFYADQDIEYLKTMTYKRQLEILWKVVPRTNTFIVSYDTLITSTDSTFKRVAKFLHIDSKWSLEPLTTPLA
jgi:hypothetical protein